MIEVVEFVLGLALPFAAGRLGGQRADRAVMAAALGATAFVLLDLLALPAGASPLPGALGAAIGYRVARGRIEGAVVSAADDGAAREAKRARMVRRVLVGVVSGAFAGACMAWALTEQAADVRATWQIRSAIGGVLAAIALIGALVARVDLVVTDGHAASDGPSIGPGSDPHR